MKGRNDTSTYPSMADLATFAREGAVEDLLLGLSRRIDEMERIKYQRSVGAFEHKSDNPKASWGECGSAGEMFAGESPEYQEAIIKALLSYCTEVRIKKMMEPKEVGPTEPIEKPKGVN